jgi:hypothetical protein
MKYQIESKQSGMGGISRFSFQLGVRDGESPVHFNVVGRTHAWMSRLFVIFFFPGAGIHCMHAWAWVWKGFFMG